VQKEVLNQRKSSKVNILEVWKRKNKKRDEEKITC
jgi:hypothetical protein